MTIKCFRLRNGFAWKGKTESGEYFAAMAADIEALTRIVRRAHPSIEELTLVCE